MSESDTAGAFHSIDDFEPDGSPIDEYLSDFVRLPGFRSAGEDCNELKPVGFCDRGHVQLGGKDPCGTRGCPEHWRQWQRRAAVSIVARLAAYRAAQGDRWDVDRRAIHAVTAPEQEQRWTVSRFWEQRSESYAKLEQAGARGAAVIPHGYSSSDEGEDQWCGAVEAGLDPSYGKWRLFRGLADGEWGEMLPLIEVAPHDHHIAPAVDLDGEAVDAIEAETGWVVKNIRSLERFYVDANDALPALSKQERAEARRSDKPEFEALQEAAAEKAMAGYEDMARLGMYLLSHAAEQPAIGDLPQRQTVTYWGEVHPNSFDPEAELDEEAWATIQELAAAAVGAAPLEDVEDGALSRECSRDGCEAVVWPLTHLVDRLGDPDHSWWDSLDFDQQCELLGAAQWMDHKPPPGITGDLPPGGFDRSPSKPPGVETEADWIEWLRELGRRRYDRLEVPVLTATMNPQGGESHA